MNIAVTGGTGRSEYIGRHVIDRLLAQRHEVTVFSTKVPQRRELAHVPVDMTDLQKATEALKGPYDAVFALSAIDDVNEAFRNPVQTAYINTMGVVTLLEAARRNGIPRVLLPSTVWVYSLAGSDSVDEDTPLHLGKAAHIYTASRIAAELYCHCYYAQYNQGYTILRCGVTYGPGERGLTVLATFVQRALRGEPLTIFGDGSQTVNFIYIDDLADGIVASLQNVAACKVYNLVGKRPVTVTEIAETVRKYVEDAKIVYVGGPATQQAGSTANYKKAEIELGWEPKVGLTEGVGKYIEWYKVNVLNKFKT